MENFIINSNGVEYKLERENSTFNFFKGEELIQPFESLGDAFEEIILSDKLNDNNLYLTEVGMDTTLGAIGNVFVNSFGDPAYGAMIYKDHLSEFLNVVASVYDEAPKMDEDIE